METMYMPENVSYMVWIWAHTLAKNIYVKIYSTCDAIFGLLQIHFSENEHNAKHQWNEVLGLKLFLHNI